MNVEIGAEAAQFPEKEYINGVFIAVCVQCSAYTVVFQICVFKYALLL
jgi:hypothetical protein